MSKKLIYFTNFKNADLTNVNADTVHFFGCDFTDTKLNGVSGKQIFIVESDFTNAEMKNGMLIIKLEKFIPENKKPKLINIK